MDDKENLHPTPDQEPTPPAEATPAKLPAPKCPYCGADPMMLLARAFNIGPFKLLISFCKDCRNTVPAALMAIAEPQIARVPAGSRIIPPNGH